MPGKKKKYNSRFPPARIKKIMQTDEEVGKVAAAVPVIISRGLELFVESLLIRAGEVTASRHARTLTPAHLKQCIMAEKKFDFLQELVASVPDIGPEGDSEPGTPSLPFTPSFPTPNTTQPPFSPPHSTPPHLPLSPQPPLEDEVVVVPVVRGRGRGRPRGRGRGSRGRGGVGQTGPNAAPKISRPRGRPRKVVAPVVAERSDDQDSDDGLSLDVDTDENMDTDTDEEVIVAAEHSTNSSSSSSSSSSQHKPSSPAPASFNPSSTSSTPSSSTITTSEGAKVPPSLPLSAPASVPSQFGIGDFKISIGKQYSLEIVPPTTPSTTATTTSAPPTTTNNHKPPPPPVPGLYPIRAAFPPHLGIPRPATSQHTPMSLAAAPHSPLTPGTRPFFGVPVPVITSVHALNSRAFAGENTSATAFTGATSAMPLSLTSQVDEDYDS